MPADKMKQLMEKRDAIAARIRKEQNKLKASERSTDTRRKILAGAAVLEWAGRDSEFSVRLYQELGRFLIRNADRELFALPSVGGKEETAPASPQRGTSGTQDLTPKAPRLEEV
jgi:hypothetical protein